MEQEDDQLGNATNILQATYALRDRTKITVIQVDQGTAITYVDEVHYRGIKWFLDQTASAKEENNNSNKEEGKDKGKVKPTMKEKN